VTRDHSAGGALIFWIFLPIRPVSFRRTSAHHPITSPTTTGRESLRIPVDRDTFFHSCRKKDIDVLKMFQEWIDLSEDAAAIDAMSAESNGQGVCDDQSSRTNDHGGRERGDRVGGASAQ